MLTLLFAAGLSHAQATVSLATIGAPLDTQLYPTALLQIGGELIGIGVPSRTPALRHYLLTIDIDLDIARVVQDELIVQFTVYSGEWTVMITLLMGSRVIITVHCTLSTVHWLDVAFVNDVGTLKVEVLGEVLDAAIVGLLGNERFLGRTIFIIDTILVADQFLALCIDIGAGEVTLATLFVVEFKGTVELQVIVGVTKTAVAVAIPQQTVVLIGDNKRYADLGVILEQILVLALHVKLLALVLPQTVESLIVRTVELHLPCQAMLMRLGNGVANPRTQLALRYGKIPELLTILRLVEQLLASGIEESDATGGFLYHRLHLLGFNDHVVALVGDGVAALDRCSMGHNHQRGRLSGQRLMAGGTHTDNLVVNHFEVHYLCLTTIRQNRHIVSVGLHHGCQHRRG